MRNKFYDLLKDLSIEIENIKDENVGVWLEENIVHIENNNELIYTYGGPSIRIYIDSEIIKGYKSSSSEPVFVSVNTQVFKEYLDLF